MCCVGALHRLLQYLASSPMYRDLGIIVGTSACGTVVISQLVVTATVSISYMGMLHPVLDCSGTQ